MDRASLENDLRMVEAALALGRAHVRELRRLISNLDKRDEHDTAREAREALQKTLENQNVMKQRRDELRFRLTEY